MLSYASPWPVKDLIPCSTFEGHGTDSGFISISHIAGKKTDIQSLSPANHLDTTVVGTIEIMSFSFGFSGDDIENEEAETNNGVYYTTPPQGTSNDLPELVKASRHDMDQWVSAFQGCSHRIEGYVLVK